MSDLGIA